MHGSHAGRWSLAALVVVAALIVAIWPRGGDGSDARTDRVEGAAPTAVERSAGDTDGVLAAARSAAALAPCPDPVQGDNAVGPLTGVDLVCLGDGRRVDVGAALAGRPAVVNIWAYWCGPCARELPALDEYARRTAGAVTVLTVHQDSKERNALSALAEYGVHLPGVQDGAARVATALGAPRVLPVTALLRADGTVAAVLPRPFDSADDIADAVRRHLGVVS